MTWSIINSFQSKIAKIHDKCMLTLGNTKECEIFIDSKIQNRIISQIYLDNGFIFYIQENRVKTFFLNKTLHHKDHKIEIIYSTQKDFFLNILGAVQHSFKQQFSYQY